MGNGMSSLRSEQAITIYRPFIQAEPILREETLKMKIGGFLGIGTKPCSVKVTFNRSHYCPGDPVQVKL